MAAIDRIKEFLAKKDYAYMEVRKAFVCTNGVKVSLQQSAYHRSTSNSLEIWHGPKSELLEPYGEGPFNYVPLDVAAKYIEEIENATN